MAKRGIHIDTATRRWWTHSGQVYHARTQSGATDVQVKYFLQAAYRSGWQDKADEIAKLRASVGKRARQYQQERRA